MTSRAGLLYLVGTPIGNLEDITLRALRVLREVDLIAAEDTRVTRVLLRHYHIPTPLLSYHQHSPPRRVEQLLTMLRQGKQVALVSDAGMPGISDPGARLVRACADAAIPVAVVPGPTAVSAALALSGIPAGEFLFLGFLPTRARARQQALRRAADWPAALVCFEAPHRLRESLADLCHVLGDRQAACGRELTKRFEEVLRGRLSELARHFSARQPRGELTIVISGAAPGAAPPDLSDALGEARELIAAGLSPSRAAAHVARRRAVPRRALYRLVMAQPGEPR